MADSVKNIPGYQPTDLLEPKKSAVKKQGVPAIDDNPDKFPACPPLGPGVKVDDLFKSQDAGGKLPVDPNGFDRVDPFGMYVGYDLVTPATHKLEPLYLPDPERAYCGLSAHPKYTTDNPRAVDIVFIGGGMAGINFGIMAQWRLKNAKYRIYEKNPEVGGTWWDNRYPGLRCDVPSYAYTFRFENNDWTEGYAQGPEIQRYMARVAKKYNVENLMTFNATVTVLEWLEDRKKWKVGIEVEGKMRWDEADFVINGCGFLNRPKNPDIEGFESFKGKVAHTARWPKDLVIKPTDRIGVIGTGSSGLQVCGALAPVVKQGHLDIFMRTPSYILPEQAPLAFTPEQKKMLNDRAYFWKYTMEGWEGGERFFTVYFAGSRNQQQVRERAEKFMRKEIKDPVLLKKMLPDYPIGCRRLTFTRPFLAAIHMPHVFVNTDPIVRIDATGVITKSKETSAEIHTPLDIMVSATGFDTSFIQKNMKVTGRNGRDLWDAFQPYPKAYRSVTVPGFPNYSFTMGPAAPLAHNSIYHETEQQINYALQMIVRWQCDPSILSYEVRMDKTTAFNEEAQKFLRNTVWINQCGGWYNNRNKGYLLQWPGSGMHHMLSLTTPDYNDYIVEKAGARL